MKFHRNTEQDSGYKARYLVLLNDRSSTQRALLFGLDHQYLTEVIDEDGMLLENLTRSGTACAAPKDIASDAREMAGKPAALELRCYALG